MRQPYGTSFSERKFLLKVLEVENLKMKILGCFKPLNLFRKKCGRCCRTDGQAETQANKAIKVVQIKTIKSSLAESKKVFDS